MVHKQQPAIARPSHDLQPFVHWSDFFQLFVDKSLQRVLGKMVIFLFRQREQLFDGLRDFQFVVERELDRLRGR